MTVDGTISPSYKYLLTEESKVELIAWLTKWKARDALKYCEITSILFCEEREPTWVNVIKLIQMLFFGLWFFLVLTIAAGGRWRELSFSFWASFLCGLSIPGMRLGGCMDDTTIIGSTLENKSLRRFKLGLYPLELIIADPDYSVGKFWFLDGLRLIQRPSVLLLFDEL